MQAVDAGTQAASEGHAVARAYDVAAPAAPVARLPVLGWRGLRLARQIAPIEPTGTQRTTLFTSSGRAAIFLALDLLGVRAGDRVLVPTYHCPTMIAPIVRLGATPVFYPVDRAACADLAWLEHADSAGCKALIAPHFFGLPLPMGPLKSLCTARGIALIEDCAHASFGAVTPATLGGFGDLTITSLPKFFPVMEGGALIGPHTMLERLHLSAPGAVDELRAVIDAVEIGVQHGRFGVVGTMLGTLSRLKRSLRPRRSVPAAAGQGYGATDAVETWLDEKLLRRRCTAMTRWTAGHTAGERLVAQRQANYRLWTSLMQDVPGARPLFPDLPAGAVPYVFPLLVDDPEAKYQALRAQGVPIFRWDVAWPNIPDLPGDHGRRWLTDVFQLGCHQDLGEGEIRQLAAVVRRVIAPGAR